MSEGSVVFDRAADHYDRTRALPPETAAAQTALLAGELGAADGAVLEVGVGTGRIAVPLAKTGVPILGIDLSARMLEALAAKRSAVAAVRASAVQLPIRSQAVGAVIACHVLHLIGDWQQAVGEILRVLKPGGLLLAARGRGDGPQSDVRRMIREAAGVAASASRLDSLDELDDFLLQRGAAVRLLPTIPNPATISAADYLQRTAANTYSWTWDIPADRLLLAVREIQEWFARAVGDPAETQLSAAEIRWHRYRMP